MWLLFGASELGNRTAPLGFMKGIIYTRVSSDEQVKGTSLDDQEVRCRQYCKENGIEVLRVFREEGASAKSTDRPEFLNAIEFCRKNKGRVDIFMVWKLDRFARNMEDHVLVKKTLLEYKTTLQSVSEPSVNEEPVGKMLGGLLALFSEFDNDIRRQRCTNGMLAKLNRGIFPWKPPIGYACAHFKKRGEKKTESDPPDEKIFPIIQKGLKEYARDMFTSQVELAKALDEYGLKEACGKKTTPQLVDRLLGKFLKFYAGILVNPWTGEEIEGLHKPMITKEEMYKIQLVRSGKTNLVGRNRYNPDFPLRRTVICASCSVPLTGSSPRGNGGKYFYYHCQNKKCSDFGKSITKAILEKEFLLYLERIAPKAKFLAVFKETILDLWQEKGQQFNLGAKKYEHQLTQLEAKKKRIYDMREDGSYTKEEFLERKQEVENEVMATKISLSETRIEQFDIEAALTYAINFIGNLGKQWFDLSPQLRPRFQKLVFPEGIPYSRAFGYGTAKLGLIYEINRQSGGDLSHVVDSPGIEPGTRQCECRVMPFYYEPFDLV